NADERQTWSKHFETESDTQSRFNVSEKIASTLISRIRSGVSAFWKRERLPLRIPASKRSSGSHRRRTDDSESALSLLPRSCGEQTACPGPTNLLNSVTGHDHLTWMLSQLWLKP